MHIPNRWCLIILAALVLIACGHALAIYLIYFRCHHFNGCSSVKVLALNTWGMPKAFGSE